MCHPSFVCPQSRLDIKTWSDDTELLPQSEVLQFLFPLVSNSLIKNWLFYVNCIRVFCLAQGEEQIYISPGGLSVPEVQSQIPSQLDCLADSKITCTDTRA